MHVDYSLIGKRIKSERKLRGYTQEILAERLDVSIGYISQVERGITKISLDLLAAIATALQCDLSFLVTGTAVENQNYMLSEINELYNQLNTKNRKFALDMMRLLIHSQQ